MVGGRVIEVAEVVWDGDRRVFIDCREQVWSDREQRKVPIKQTCAILVEPDDRTPLIEPGDVVWWQGGVAFWTPRDRSDEADVARALVLGLRQSYDIQLRKVGGSGVKMDFLAEEGRLEVLSSRKRDCLPVD